MKVETLGLSIRMLAPCIENSVFINIIMTNILS
jgi:hypothetical protein